MPTTGTMRYLTIGDSTYEVYNTDTEVIQTYAAASGYTNWRPLVVGYSSNSSETTAPTTITGTTYTFNTIKVKPSDGIIRFGAAALYNGDYTTTISADTLTAARTLTAPDKSGTIALTSDIPSLTGYATTTYVDTAIAALPEPMIFKGSLGTGGTITSLPAASSSNEGFTYKVITAGTYDSQSAKIGDTFISDGNNWILIPSGDEPSGTVTSVGISNATDGGLSISGSPITSSGTVSIGHSNVLSSAQTTSGIYPIKIDKNGHISEYGSAVTVPSITLNGSTTTSPSFYAPTLVGTSGYVLKSNGSGAPEWTSAELTDEKLGLTSIVAGSTYYLIVAKNNETSTAVKRQYDSSFSYYTISGTTTTDGQSTLTLGNMISSGTAGNKRGELRIFGAGEGVTTVVSGTGSGNYVTLPSSTGTLALTSDIPTVPTISLNGSSTTSASFYAPTTAGTSGYYLKSNGSGAPTWSAISDEIFIAEYNSTTYADVLAAYNAGKTIICKEIFSSASTYYAYLEKCVDNTFYFATPGENNNGSKAIYTYTLTSNGTWSSDDISLNIPSITLNGSSTTSASFYAPTTAGTSGQVLTSNGSGAPTWAAASGGTDEKLKIANDGADNTTYYLIFGSNSTNAETKKIDSTGIKYLKSEGGTNSGGSVLELGNNLAKGTTGNKRGALKLYGEQNKSTVLETKITSTGAGSNASVAVYFPDKGGTIALTDDITTYTATSPIDITSGVISHEDSGVTAGTYDGGGVKSTGFYVPSITVDAKGHVTSATDLGNLIPVVTSSNSNENGNVIGTRTWALATRSYSAYPSVLAAGNTSKTITISSDSNSAYTYAKYFRVVDVEAFDAVTKEPVIVDWSASALYSNNSSVTVTVSIASAYTNNIWLYVLLSVGYGSM